MNAQNVKPKKVSIHLNGEDKEVLFDMNAFVDLEEIYGSVDAAMQALEKGSMKAIRTILWAGLHHTDINLKERTVGAWLTMENLAEASKSLSGALTTSLPIEEESPNEVTQEPAQ